MYCTLWQKTLHFMSFYFFENDVNEMPFPQFSHINLLSASHFLTRGLPSMPLSCHRTATVGATCGTVR